MSSTAGALGEQEERGNDQAAPPAQGFCQLLLTKSFSTALMRRHMTALGLMVVVAVGILGLLLSWSSPAILQPLMSYLLVHRQHPAVHFVTYGDESYGGSRARLLAEANATGWFRTVTACTPDDIPAAMRRQYADILAEPRGGGYWAWKPMILDQALRRMNDSEILVYADAGCRLNPAASNRFWAYVDKLAGQNEFDILSFRLEAHRTEQNWTTEKIFQYFGVSADSPVRDSPQLMATVRLLRRGPNARRWLNRVLGALSANRWLFSDRYNNETISSMFQENRHDQSVMSVAAKLEGGLVLDDETWPPGQTAFPIWAARVPG